MTNLDIRSDDRLVSLENFNTLTIEDYVVAAKFFNLGRTRGIQGSNTDFLICAVAVRNDLAVFTTDKDFLLFAKHLPIVLHKVKAIP